MSQFSLSPRWRWCVGIGLVLSVAAVTCVFLDTHNRTPLNLAGLETNNSSADVSSSLPSSESSVTETETSPPVPPLEFELGSVEEACGFSELPTYSTAASFGALIARNTDHANTFESEECRAAMEKYMSATNPQRFLSDEPYRARLVELVVLAEPFTFERIFTDPSGDLQRVQDSLSRPECLLTGDETNWELKETCHADALLNYAFVNIFCFDDGIENRIRPVRTWESFNKLTLEQDRTLWKQDLEDSWMVAKCATLDPTLELSAEYHPEIHALVISWDETKRRSIDNPVEALLIELAARLGDDAAGLSQPVSRIDRRGWFFQGAGYKFGPINELTSDWHWYDFKQEPNTNDYLNSFLLLARLDSPKKDRRYEFDLDWEFVVRHLCAPPFFERRFSGGPKLVEIGEHLSCKEIVHEIRQKGITLPPLHNTLDKFEQVALKLDLYE